MRQVMWTLFFGGALCVVVGCGGTRLGPFMATPFAEPRENEDAEPRVRHLPYDKVVTLLDYIPADAEPDEIVDGKPMYYLYLWLPAYVPEIGVRAVSPVRNIVRPEPDHITTPAWEQGQDDYDSYFDTFITFERTEIYRESEIHRAHSLSWNRVASNDDTEEIHAQPSGEFHNSLLRVTERSHLTAGLVRIGITDYKNREVAGTYVLQIGLVTRDIDEQSQARMARLALARTPQDLMAKLEQLPQVEN